MLADIKVLREWDVLQLDRLRFILLEGGGEEEIPVRQVQPNKRPAHPFLQRLSKALPPEVLRQKRNQPKKKNNPPPKRQTLRELTFYEVV